MKNFLIALCAVAITLVIVFTGQYFINKPTVVTDIPNAEACGQGSCTDTSRLEYGYDVGDVIPNITLTDFEGNQVQLYDIMDGYDKVVISLQADWCTDCHRQNDKMIQDGAIPENVLYIPIYTKYSIPDTPEKTSSYDNSKIYADSEFAGTSILPYYDVDDKLYDAFDVKGTPTNIVLDSNARIKAISLEYDADTLMLNNTETVPYTKQDTSVE